MTALIKYSNKGNIETLHIYKVILSFKDIILQQFEVITSDHAFFRSLLFHLNCIPFCRFQGVFKFYNDWYFYHCIAITKTCPF